MSNGNEFGNEQQPYENNGSEGLDSGTPAVAAGKGKVFAVLVTAVGVIGFVLYSLFSGGDEKPVEAKREGTIADDTTKITSLPPPEPPTPPASIPEPPPPPVPPTPPAPPEPIFPDAPVSPGVSDEVRRERLKSPMLLVNAPSNPFEGQDKAAKDKAKSAIAGSDPNAAFAQNAIASSEAEKAEATTLGDLRTTIAQGKIIDAVLETAINTDLPSTLRAIISRDVYAEAGREPLIPKGSRLIGNYNTGILRGQKRVFIVWTRVIRPDGVDIAIGSPGVDNLGRAGLEGAVDNKYIEMFTGAALTSTLSIGVAIAGEQFVDDPQVTTSSTTQPGGSTNTQQGSAGATATKQAVEQIGDVGKNVVKGLLDLRPTITVNQGTPIDVMVNRDLAFPNSVLNNARFVE